MIYTFISHGNTSHQIFNSAQQNLNQFVLQLERLVGTRWHYWYRSINKFLLRYEAILATLHATVLLNNDSSSEAKCLAAQLESPMNIYLLHIIKRVLSKTNSQSEQLQEEGLVILQPMRLTDATISSLQHLRCDSE